MAGNADDLGFVGEVYEEFGCKSFIDANTDHRSSVDNAPVGGPSLYWRAER